ncbi:MAG: choice-of-anchor Q domain-containing protein [Deltaproteobacteria bacterium]|nr:choice-of-anchor Q domain-containing protein [Deltaproteobacteria bacterium]
MSILTATALCALTVWPVYADGVVTDCTNDAQLSILLGGDGTITFDCGTATIVLSTTKIIKKHVTIDGGGTITLSGDNARRLFMVEPGARLELDDIVIEKGFSKGGDGGAIYNQDTVSLYRTTFRNNATTAEWSGGAIYSSSHLAMYEATFSSNEAGSGGAIALAAAINQTNITASTFDHNVTSNVTMQSGNGGALLITGGATATVGSSTFSDNQARQGGAIAVRDNAMLFLDGTVIEHNKANGDGGGIDVDLSTASLSNATLSRNDGGQGGGFSTFAGTVTLTAVTLFDNSAAFGAGYYTFLGTHTFTNVTLSGNDAQSSGGGIYNSRGVMTLTNVTLAGNRAGSASGIVNGAGGPDPNLKLRNVLIAKGDSGANCFYSVPPTLIQNSLSDDASCGFGAGRDNVNLLLGPLANNGGATETHHPQPGSPASGGAAHHSCPATDQRGGPRPQGAVCDVGAVEVGPATPTPTGTPTPTSTPTPSASPTAPHTATASASATPTRSTTPTANDTATPTPPPSPTRTASATVAGTSTRSATATPTAPATSTASSVATASPTQTATRTVPPAATESVTATVTPTDSVVPTTSPTVPVVCVGDCDASGAVTINELVSLVGIALGQQRLFVCAGGDADHSGAVTIDELLLAVNNTLRGCPAGG